VAPELKAINKEEFQAKPQPVGKRKHQIFFDLREEN
jgi:hypothetical protein